MESLQFLRSKKVFFCFFLVALMSLLACSRPKTGCVVAELHNLSVCFDRDLFTSPPSLPSDKLKRVMLSVPESEFSFSQGMSSSRNVDLWLHENFLDSKSTLKRMLVDYENSDVPSELESGMVVRHAAKKDTGFFTEDLLYPQNGDAVFFVCARPWNRGDGTTVRIGCTAHVTWDVKTHDPRVELTYTLPRDQLINWKQFDQAVRNYVVEHQIVRPLT